MNNNKILIIEDDKDILASSCEILQEAGYKVVTASNGEDGIKLAKNEAPNLIISDIMMPQKSGYEVKEVLEKDSSTNFIPFIFLTAKASVKDIRYGMQLGADDYLIKPYRAADLLNAVEVRLNKIQQIKNRLKINVNSETKNVEDKYSKTDSILLNINGTPMFIKLNDIKLISAESEYSKIYLASGECNLVRKLLKEWESILPQKTFVRVHRSTIINIDYIEKIDKWFKRSFKVKMKDIKIDVIISQRFASKLKNNLNF